MVLERDDNNVGTVAGDEHRESPKRRLVLEFKIKKYIYNTLKCILKKFEFNLIPKNLLRTLHGCLR